MWRARTSGDAPEWDSPRSRVAADRPLPHSSRTSPQLWNYYRTRSGESDASAEVRVEPRRDVVSGFEPEHVTRLRNVRLAVIDVTRPRVDVDDLRVGVRHVADRFGELADCDTVSSADIECLAGGLLGGGREQVCLDDVVDVDEVPGLGPVALDGEIVARACLIAEDTDNAAVVAALLSGPISVEVPERDRVDAVTLVVEPAVVIGGKLFESVRRGRSFWMRLVDRQRPQMAVDRGAGREDDARVRVPGGLEDCEERIDIHRVARLGVVDGALDADLRRLVEDHVGGADGLAEGFVVADVSVDERGVVGNVFPGARREIIVDCDGAVVDESVTEVAADEAGTAGDERVIEVEHCVGVCEMVCREAYWSL